MQKFEYWNKNVLIGCLEHVYKAHTQRSGSWSLVITTFSQLLDDMTYSFDIGNLEYAKKKAFSIFVCFDGV